uniref:enoyl-CoA hydratase n=1 Tax=Globodera rostochiensis TaxID=31243 RepID=A0A914GW21_GLORO
MPPLNFASSFRGEGLSLCPSTPTATSASLPHFCVRLGLFPLFMDPENKRLKHVRLKERAEWWERLSERYERNLKLDARLQAQLAKIKRLRSDCFYEDAVIGNLREYFEEKLSKKDAVLGKKTTQLCRERRKTQSLSEELVSELCELRDDVRRLTADKLELVTWVSQNKQSTSASLPQPPVLVDDGPSLADEVEQLKQTQLTSTSTEQVNEDGIRLEVSVVQEVKHHQSVKETPHVAQHKQGKGTYSMVTCAIKSKGIAVIKIDMPNVKENSLNDAVSEALRKEFDAIEQNPSVRGIVLMSGKPNSYLVGADIGMLSRCDTAEAAASISRNVKAHFDRMECSKKPIVAAISGSCMGGGLEMALACHYRIAVNSSMTQFALPEVMLGLLPFGGGTQRLPKLIALQSALDMMLTGKIIGPDTAKTMGLVDQLVQPSGLGLDMTHRSLERVAVLTCAQLAAGTLKVDRKRPLLERTQKTPLLRKVMMGKARSKVMGQTDGKYPAPLRILDVVHTGLVDGLEKGYEEETKQFGNLTQTKESEALIGLFKGQTKCKDDKNGTAHKVIGADLVGSGIANVSIDKGIKTFLPMDESNFVVRCRGVILKEMVRLLQEGVSPRQVDKITTEFGFLVGMATLADEVEFDVGAFLDKSVRGSPSELAELTSAGFKGKESGRGIYTYKKSKRVQNPKVQEILARNQLNPPASVSSVQDQQMRVVSRFVNEALICLEEGGIISSPAEGDLASVFGLGFPPFWGGPFRFVDLYGAEKLVKDMRRYGSNYTEEEFQALPSVARQNGIGRKILPKMIERMDSKNNGWCADDKFPIHAQEFTLSPARVYSPSLTFFT